MFKQLLRLSSHSIIYGFGVVVSQLVGFFLIPLYTRYLTPGDYGALEIFTATMSVLSVVFGLGLTTALFRSYYLHDDAEKKKTVISTAFLFLTATSAILTLLLIGLSHSFSTLLFHSGEYTFYFRVIFLTLFCNTGVAIGLSVLQARQEPTRYALVAVSQVVISIALNIVFVIVLHKGVLGILEATLIAAAMIYLSLMATLIKRAGFSFSRDELKRMLAFGLPLVPAGLSSWILTLSDRYFLQFLSTPTELGLYSLGYKFGMVISPLLVGPFQLAFTPFTFYLAKEQNAKQTFSRILTYFMLVAMLAALALSVLSREVLAIMATPAFHSAYKVIPLIALSYVLYGCYFVLMVGINLEGKTRSLAVFVACAAVLNLGLNYTLIPHYGMMGAAIATLISYIILPVGSYLVSQRYYPIKYEWGRVAKICLAFGVIFAGSLFIPYQSGVVTGVYKLLTLLAYPILLYVFRFYHPEEIQKTKEIIKAAPGYLKRRLLRPL
jgi:O-antigen/teichoic acid export membrane protein